MTTRTARATATSPYNAFFTLYAKNLDLWTQASQMMLGSSEVIGHRMTLLGNSSRGLTPVPYAEIARMWQEKALAALALFSGAGQSAIRNAGKTEMDGNKLMHRQLDDAAKALKPYTKAVNANKKRLRNKKR